MQNKIIYIDEFGNAHLELSKKGTFSHFVYATVIIDETDIEQARSIRERISKKYFQGHPIKSSSISNDSKGFKKRLEILEELLALKFDIISLVANKKALDNPGFKRKEVFYKFFSNLLIKQFPNVFASFSIYADKLGYPEFQADLKSFINTQATQRDLFNPDRYYTLVEDKQEEPLIQFADFIAGCLGKIYCNSHSHPRSKELFDKIYKRLNVDFFPYERTDFSVESLKDEHGRDAIVKRLAVNSAIEALKNWRRKLYPETKAVLEYLYMVHLSAPSRLVGSYEIIQRVQVLFPSFNKNALRKTIQQLRDVGVVIASIQGKSGYKLPDRLDDVIGFYKRYMGSIVPMLNRIDHCNKKLVWNNILLEEIFATNENFALLNELIESVKKRRLAPNLELT